MISDQNNWSKGLMTLYTSRALHQAKEGQKRELRSFQINQGKNSECERTCQKWVQNRDGDCGWGTEPDLGHK